jgi:hypothetical protein
VFQKRGGGRQTGPEAYPNENPSTTSGTFPQSFYESNSKVWWEGGWGKTAPENEVIYEMFPEQPTGGPQDVTIVTTADIGDTVWRGPVWVCVCLTYDCITSQ